MERLLVVPSAHAARTKHCINSTLGAAQVTIQIPTVLTKREAGRTGSQPAQTFMATQL